MTNIENVDNCLLACLDNGQKISCNHILFATGFKPNIQKISFLKRDNLLQQLQTKNGSPVLYNAFESNLPGLYFTGMFAMADFGYSFGFSTGAPTAAKILVKNILHKMPAKRK